jgi:hypothetical protein
MSYFVFNLRHKLNRFVSKQFTTRNACSKESQDDEEEDVNLKVLAKYGRLKKKTLTYPNLTFTSLKTNVHDKEAIKT